MSFAEDNAFEIGQTYRLTVEGKILVGVLDRIVKMSAPCVPSQDPREWSYHFTVNSADLSIAGSYYLRLNNIIDNID